VVIIKKIQMLTWRKIIDIVVDAEVKNFVVISSLVLSKDDFNLLLERERRIALDIQKEGIDLVLNHIIH
jgi:uncharacterized protein